MDDWLATAVWDEKWHNVVDMADRAGRQAARMLAGRCSSWELRQGGQVGICVAPPDSPLATWLWPSGRQAPGVAVWARVSAARTAVAKRCSLSWERCSRRDGSSSCSSCLMCRETVSASVASALLNSGWSTPTAPS